jgi:hypothetical protein
MTTSPDGFRRSLTVYKTEDDYKFVLHRWESGHLTEEFQGAVPGTRYSEDVRSAMVWQISSYYWKTAQSLSVGTAVHLTDWIIRCCVEIQFLS